MKKAAIFLLLIIALLIPFNTVSADSQLNLTPTTDDTNVISTQAQLDPGTGGGGGGG